MNLPRARAKNFTHREERILEKLIHAHRDVIDSKQNDAHMWSKKAEAWQKIATDFELQSGMQRPWQALREKYASTLRSRRQRTFNRNGDDDGALDNDSKEYDHKLSIAAVSSLVEEESSTDLDPEYNPSNNLGSNYSEIENFLHPEVKLKEEPADDPEDEDSESINVMTDEKLALLQLQQDYYRGENSRAAEKHKFEMEKHQFELEQRKMEIEKYKLDLEKNREELRGIRMKNELLEMQLLERRGKIKDQPN
ncbi:myb/SANT-like DNA-binding domain-containing protein 4 [Drosophila takahashii]|uniref:myb/SANT-like DNA-binding domain-containing protein 4 n=1 Tax=Drosophila takahashii TaxID=29030 RepID=UPI001CF9230D|nr:uncharacterized protein LOC108059429 [Drosophila takahashii]